MLVKFGGKGKLVACVSDSYDIERACTELWGTALKDDIINMGGTLVVRPDSGDPIETPVHVVELLMSKFGYTVNQKDYKVLPSYVRVIQGDGITIDSIKKIIENMHNHGLSMSNLAFGQGSGLLQQVNRDTLRFAMKASEIVVDGQKRDVFKQPKTEAFKASKKGRLALVKDGDQFVTIRESELNDRRNYLEPVFKNGEILRNQTLSEIREQAHIS